MKQYSLKKYSTIVVVISLVSMLCIGCATDQKEHDEKWGGTEAISDTSHSDNTGMGRYVEKTVLERDSYWCTPQIQHTTDGTLILQDMPNRYVSQDNGSSWSCETIDWMEEFSLKNEILDVVSSNDKTVMLTYQAYTEQELAQIQGLVSDESNDTNDLGTLETTDTQEREYLVISPSGTQTKLEIESNNPIRKLTFDESGKLWAYTQNAICSIDITDGTMTELVTVNGSIRYIQNSENILLCMTYDGPVLYDITTKKWIADTVLDQLITDHYGSFKDYGMGFNFYTFLGEENMIYIAGKKGLYRHVIGGSSVEQIIDGNLSSLSNPAHTIRYATLLDNQEFLIGYSDGSFVKCTYDASVPTLPSEKLTIYSLQENDTVRQAISVFQTRVPELYVSYEIGMNSDEITREDALKKLNTDLVNGSGPDILIVDDMPYDSYVDKGIFMDLNSTIQEIHANNSLFINLITPLYTGECLYSVPAEFQLPVMAGHQQTVELADDLTGFANAVEELRSQTPNQQLLEKCSAYGLLKSFSIVCAPSWKNAQGNIQKETIQEYLLQCKRIYDAQIDGTPTKAIKEYDSMNDFYKTEFGVSYENSPYFHWADAGNYLAQNEQIVYGVLYDLDSYTSLLATSKINGFEDTKIKQLDGQSQHVYYPITMAGICATTQNQEQAVQFIQLLLGKDVQKFTHYGYPINQKAFEECFVVDEYDVDGSYLTLGMTIEDGTTLTWNAYVPNQQQIDQLTDWVMQAKTPYISDSIIEEAIYTEGANYLCGEQDLDTAIQTILDKISIYIEE